MRSGTRSSSTARLWADAVFRSAADFTAPSPNGTSGRPTRRRGRSGCSRTTGRRPATTPAPWPAWRAPASRRFGAEPTSSPARSSSARWRRGSAPDLRSRPRARASAAAASNGGSAKLSMGFPESTTPRATRSSAPWKTMGARRHAGGTPVQVILTPVSALGRSPIASFRSPGRSRRVAKRRSSKRAPGPSSASSTTGSVTPRSSSRRVFTA